MNKRSAWKYESSNPVKPIYTTSVEVPHVVEMQKEDEEEEDSREDEDVQPVFCRKPPEGLTESEKREHEVTHIPFKKGAGTEWVTALLGRDLRNFGIADSSTIALKSDQEPVLLDLLKDVQRWRVERKGRATTTISAQFSS